MAIAPMTVGADVTTTDGRKGEIVGQSRVAKSGAHVDHFWITPPNPPTSPEALKAIYDADWVILGPGSWYTSVIVHLLVPELAQALEATQAKRLVTVNLTADSETSGLGVVDHLNAMHAHAPGFWVDAVLVDPSSIEDLAATERAAARLGAYLVVRPVATGDGSPTHDPAALAAAYQDIFNGKYEPTASAQ